MRPIGSYDDARRRLVPGGIAKPLSPSRAGCLGAGGGEGLVDELQGVSHIQAGCGQME